MGNISILYWEPGSGGDFVHNLLLTQSNEYYGVIEKFNIDDHGRVVPNVSSFIKETFDHDSDEWYLRVWTVDDIEALSTLTKCNPNRTFVLPTHCFEQVIFLKSQIPSAKTIGITYPSNMFSLVLKNWCRKCAATDKKLAEIYNQPLHQYLRSKNVFGEYVLSEQLKFGSRIRTTVDDLFDTAICLEKLYARDIFSLKTLFQNSDHLDHMFNAWIQKQSIIHQYHNQLPDSLKLSLGYNSVATQQGSLDVGLDVFDNVLINHFNQLSPPKNFKTLQQAADFFR
jgi:hypothetical protein